ncbi:MAG: helix-turn-helix domain-containing protein [Haloferacaceae archaeon]
MPEAKFLITLPEGVWVSDVSRSFPAVTFRVLSVLTDDATGVGLLELAGPEEDVPAILAEIDDHGGIDALDVIQQVEGQALVRFETSSPLLLLAAQRSGVPLGLPLEIQDGKASLELTAPHERFSELGDELRSFGLSYTIEYIRPQVERDELLTDRQRELLATAVDLGYYDTPRECTLTELADHLGVAKSTASERMHRAEGAVIRSFVDERVGPSGRAVETLDPSSGR